MPITPKKYLNDTGVNSIIQETRRRIEEAGGGGSSLDGATVNITSADSDFYGKDCVITSPDLVTPTTITLDAEGKATVKISTVGTYNFTVTIGGVDYKQELIVNSNMTYAVQMAKYKLVTWADGTDAEIIAMVNAMDSGILQPSNSGWEVGDERTVHLNAMTAGDYNNAHDAIDATLVILDKKSYNGIGHFIIGFKEILYFEKMEAASGLVENNGWNDSRGRRLVDAIYDKAIPSSLKPMFKQFTVSSAAPPISLSTGVVDQSCKLSLYAEKELYSESGFNIYGHNSKDSEFNSSKVLSQLEYYKTSNNINKIAIGQSPSTYYYYWLRSPIDSYRFLHKPTGSSTSSSSYNNATESIGISPFGVI